LDRHYGLHWCYKCDIDITDWQQDRIRELEAELARYKAIIDRYAEHDSLCQMMDGRITIEYRTCTCGFDEALKEQK